MVTGKRIDDGETETLMASVSLVVAHHASFKRVFVEERFPIFSTNYW